jgi:hypothetical protein
MFVNRMLNSVSEQPLCYSSQGRFCVLTQLCRDGYGEGSGSRVLVGSTFDTRLLWNELRFTLRIQQ